MKHKDLHGSALCQNPRTESNTKFHKENKRLQNSTIAWEKRIFNFSALIAVLKLYKTN